MEPRRPTKHQEWHWHAKDVEHENKRYILEMSIIFSTPAADSLLIVMELSIRGHVPDWGSLPLQSTLDTPNQIRESYIQQLVEKLVWLS